VWWRLDLRGQSEEAWLARGAAARHGRIWDRLNVYECSDAVPLVFKHVTPRRAPGGKVLPCSGDKRVATYDN